MTVPAVSVILPFRNAQRFLPAAIASVQAQDFRDFELLAVDDGSEDGSADLVRAAATADPRVRLIDAGRRGLPGALNEGCRRARGRYLARMDGDDLALPSRLSQQVAVLEHTPDMVVIGGAIDLIDEDDRTVGETWYASTDADIRSVLAHGVSPFCHPATAIRRTAFDAVGGYRAACELAEDLDLWLRLARIGTLANLDMKVLRYRLHPASASFDRIRTQVASYFRALILNDPSRSETEQAAALETSDVWALVLSWAPPGEAAATLARSASWYVDWAVAGGYDARVDALIGAIAGLAPTDEQAAVAWALWQAATMAALGAGRLESAERHLDRGEALLHDVGRVGAEREALDGLRAAIRSRLEGVVTIEPPPGERDGGYLDSVHWLDDGRRVILAGWIARPHGEFESELSVHLAGHSPRSVTVTRIHRPDVARVMGAAHLAAGFKADVRLDTVPPAAGGAPPVSVAYQGGRRARLEDANVRVRPLGPDTVPQRPGSTIA